MKALSSWPPVGTLPHPGYWEGGGGGSESNESSESSDDETERVGSRNCAQKAPTKGAGKGAKKGPGKGLKKDVGKVRK